MDMVAGEVLAATVAPLVAADATWLADAGSCKVYLSKTAFTPSPALLTTDFTPADFDGYASKNPTAGVQTAGYDPVTGEQLIQMKEPVGGFAWITTGVTNLPQTIYGAVLLDAAEGDVLGSQTFDTPLVLTGVGQIVNLGSLIFRLPLSPLG